MRKVGRLDDCVKPESLIQGKPLFCQLKIEDSSSTDEDFYYFFAPPLLTGSGMGSGKGKSSFVESFFLKKNQQICQRKIYFLPCLSPWHSFCIVRSGSSKLPKTFGSPFDLQRGSLYEGKDLKIKDYEKTI